MKKLSILALCLSAMTFSTMASTDLNENQTVVTSTIQSENTVFTNTSSVETPLSLDNVESKTATNKGGKSWSERSLGGKILIGTGVGIFVVLALLFGTVSVG